MNYHTILTVVNEHTTSIVMARYAMALALAGNAQLILYTAHGGGVNDVLLRRGNHHREYLNTLATGLGISVTQIVTTGRLHTQLPKLVLEQHVDAVFYHMAPGEQYGNNLPRETVYYLLRGVRCDLVVMRVTDMGEPHPGHILVPLGNRGNSSKYHLLFVSGLARAFAAEVILFHVATRQRDREMPKCVTLFKEQLAQSAVTVQERRGAGRIGEEIGIEAVTRHHDLIVLGASNRGLFRTLFFGNPAGMIMGNPPCNSMLFRPRLVLV